MHRTKRDLALTLAILAATAMPANCQEDYRLIYDSTSGGMVIEVPPSQSPITAFEVRSLSGVFTGTRPDFLNGLFDVFNPAKLFRLSVDGFETTDFGPVAAPGLEVPFLASDLCVSGAVFPSGSLPELTLVDAVSNDEFDIFGCRLIDNPHTVVLSYDSATGQLSHDVLPQPRELVSLYIQSSDSPFVETGAPLGTYDAYTSSHLLKYDLNGFDDGSFGPVLPADQTNLSSNDFCVDGRFSDGPLGSVLLEGNPVPQCRTFNLTVGDFQDLPNSAEPTALTYFPISGRLLVQPPHDRSMIAFGIESASAALPPLAAESLYRRVAPNEAFFLARESSGLRNVELQLPVGLTRDDLLSDLTFAGKYDNGLDIGEFNLDVFTPPPPRQMITSVTRIGNGNAGVLLTHEIGPTVPVSIEDVTSQVELPRELIGGDQVILSATDIGTPANYRLDVSRLGIIYVAIDDRDLRQPFEWMSNPAFTGLPAPFFDTGEQLELDINADGVADEALSLWATIAPAGSYTIGPNLGEHSMLVFGAIRIIPEPTSACSFLAGLAFLSLAGRRSL